jgi:hypothetical protein
LTKKNYFYLYVTLSWRWLLLLMPRLSGPRAPARQIKADLRVTLQGNKRESLGVRLTAEKMRTLAAVTDDEWNKE